MVADIKIKGTWLKGDINGLDFVGSVSGTTDRVTVTGTEAPIINISATFEALLAKVANPLSQFAATTSAQLAGVISDENGSGKLVFSAGTLDIASGKTLIVSNSLTLAGTDATVMTFPSTSATIARTDAANTFTGNQTINGVASTGATGTGNMVFHISPVFSTSIVAARVNGGTSTTATLTFRSTTNNAISGSDFVWQTGNNGATETMRLLFQGRLGVGIAAPTAFVHTKASETGAASLCLPHGSAPTSPVNGDMWTTTAGLFVRINGVTKTVTLT